MLDILLTILQYGLAGAIITLIVFFLVDYLNGRNAQ